MTLAGPQNSEPRFETRCFVRRVTSAALQLPRPSKERCQNAFYASSLQKKSSLGCAPSAPSVRPSTYPAALTVRVCVCFTAEPEDARPASWQDRAQPESRVRGADLTAAQKTKLLAKACKLPKDSANRMLGSAAICKEVGRTPDYVTRRLIPAAEALSDDDEPFARKEQSNKGVAVKLTPRKDDAMKEKALEWGFDFSYEDMAHALMELFDFTISAQAVADHLRAAKWNLGVTSRAEPLSREGATTRSTTRPKRSPACRGVADAGVVLWVLSVLASTRGVRASTPLIVFDRYISYKTRCNGTR